MDNPHKILFLHIVVSRQSPLSESQLTQVIFCHIFIFLSNLPRFSKASFDSSKFAVFMEVDDQQNIFICTHANRDYCCGKFGNELYQTLIKKFKNSLIVKFWQISHLGGHKFAPTLMSMPNGHVWAYMNVELVEKYIIGQSEVEFAEFIQKHYRGPVGVKKEVQILDRELFKKKKWNYILIEKIQIPSTSVTHHQIIIFHRINTCINRICNRIC